MLNVTIGNTLFYLRFTTLLYLTNCVSIAMSDFTPHHQQSKIMKFLSTGRQQPSTSAQRPYEPLSSDDELEIIATKAPSPTPMQQDQAADPAPDTSAKQAKVTTTNNTQETANRQHKPKPSQPKPAPTPRKKYICDKCQKNLRSQISLDSHNCEPVNALDIGTAERYHGEDMAIATFRSRRTRPIGGLETVVGHEDLKFWLKLQLSW